MCCGVNAVVPNNVQQSDAISAVRQVDDLSTVIYLSYRALIVLEYLLCSYHVICTCAE